MKKFALDLGTSNTVLSMWTESGPETLTIPGISRLEDAINSQNSIDNSHTIPSVIQVEERKPFFPWQDKFTYIIGVPAEKKSNNFYKHSTIRNFKPALLSNGLETILKKNGKSFSAAFASRMFLKTLFKEVKKQLGHKVRDLTITVPVESFEPYRAQMKKITKFLGIRKLRLIDEPVAAAIGYGLNVDEPKNVLVIDFGGGTLDMALVEINEKISPTGRCTVTAKSGADLGGNDVDRWLVEYFMKHRAYNLDPAKKDGKFWYNELLLEARRIKESLFFKDEECFYTIPPKQFQDFQRRIDGDSEQLSQALPISKDQFIDVLEENHMYSILESCLIRLQDHMYDRGLTDADIHEIVLTGGSSLLPGVYSFFEKRFGRSKIHGWQPFDAVSYGAAAYASGNVSKSDHIVHDYAFKTYDQNSLKEQYQVIIPAKTPYPTVEHFWKRRLTPTCATGLPEKIFKLLIFEIGKKHGTAQEFIWDADGKLHEADESKPIIVPLNESDPVLGMLNPPHEPGNRKARLEISFMVNEERWLCTTVKDLLKNNLLLHKEPVVQLR
jgi:molecular chaperone DnaK